jgi:ASCH domain.
MSTIVKKCWPEYFQLILDGQKTYELRLADFKCKPGDILVLKEWSPETKEYTGREIKKRVGYVGKTKDWEVWPKEDIDKYGFQVISLLDDE